ncbi:MAG TPA: STN domain-containing protein, partial [Flavitalea sp.]|nr:STN domain-containing protein [Flavitalea sp.]
MIRFMFSGFSLLFILLFSFPSLAKTQDDIRITIRCSNLPLEKALPIVEEKSGCHLIYSEDDFDKKILVSISAQNELLTSVLNKILLKAGLQYKMMENKSVIISRIEKKEPYISISGIIKDNKENP